MKTYRIQLENIEYKWQLTEYKWKKNRMQMKNYPIQMENYHIQMEKIKYCNVWHVILKEVIRYKKILFVPWIINMCNIVTLVEKSNVLQPQNYIATSMCALDLWTPNTIGNIFHPGMVHVWYGSP
jgi:hypothetical protein